MPDLTIPAAVAARVAAGAAWLDRVAPDWVTKVRLPALSMWSPRNCVMGHVFGHFRLGVIELTGVDYATGNGGLDRESWRTVADHGFNVGPDEADQDATFDALRFAWIAEVESRRA